MTTSVRKCWSSATPTCIQFLDTLPTSADQYEVVHNGEVKEKKCYSLINLQSFSSLNTTFSGVTW